jgi:hypothetical protein
MKESQINIHDMENKTLWEVRIVSVHAKDQT